MLLVLMIVLFFTSCALLSLHVHDQTRPPKKSLLTHRQNYAKAFVSVFDEVALYCVLLSFDCVGSHFFFFFFFLPS